MTAVIIKCSHNIACLLNGQVLLHPMDMTVCPDSAVPSAQIKAVNPPVTIRGDGADAIISVHRAVRDGSVWLCRACGATRPFGEGAAAFSGECVPVRWGDRPVVAGDAQ